MSSYFLKKQHTHSFIILQAPGPLVLVTCYSPGVSDFSLLVSSTVLELVCVVHNNPTLLPLPFPHV